MKISSLLETQTPSSAISNTTSSAPEFGRDEDRLEECGTTAGAVATVSTPIGGMQKRGKGSLLKGIKTSKKYANSTAVKESVDPQNFDSDVDYYSAVKKQGQQQFSGDWDVWDEIASLENQIKYAKSDALAHTLYQKIDQLKRENGIEDEEDAYEKEYDADIKARKGVGEDITSVRDRYKQSNPQNSRHEEWMDAYHAQRLNNLDNYGRRQDADTQAHIDRYDQIARHRDADVQQSQDIVGAYADAFLDRLKRRRVGGEKEQEVDEAQWWPDREYIPKAPRKRKPQVGNRMMDISVGSPKIYYKNGKAVGEVGIDPEASPGNGSYYMKHYLSGRDMGGYDTPLEASKELSHLVRQEQPVDEGEREFNVGIAGTNNRAQSAYRPDKKPVSKPYSHTRKYAEQVAKSMIERGWKNVSNMSDHEFGTIVGDTLKQFTNDSSTMVHLMNHDKDFLPLVRRNIEHFAKEGVAEGSESDRIQALYDKLERMEERLGHDDPRVKAIRDEIRGMKDEYRVIGKQGVAEEQVNEKSKSQAQFRTMAAVAHNPEFAKKVGISQKVGKEFHSADKGSDYKKLPKKVDEVSYDTLSSYSNKRLDTDVDKKSPEQIQKMIKGLQGAISRMKGDKPTSAPKKVDEAEFTEDKLASDLYRDLQIFKKGIDKDIGSKAKDKEIVAKEESKGLWANIHAKRERIKHGSGEHMRKPGSKGAPTADALKKSANEGFDGEYDDEAGSVESDLHTLARATQGLLDTIGDRDNLPEWVQEKIAKAEGMVTASWDYLQSQKEQGIDPQVDETAAWQKKSGKNKNGGLNKKGVASYRREHPGSKLQTAVTTKPSKLKPGSKAAKRRKSFCARMSGMPGPMKDEHGKPTRKALSLRKWNC